MTSPGPEESTAVRRYQYFIDGEGDWWCDGWPVDDLELRDALSSQLYHRDGQLLVCCEDEEHPGVFQVAPLFVQDVDCQLDADGGLSRVEIVLQDGRREMLRAETLGVDGTHRLFCLAGEARLQALFFRPAFYRLMDHLHAEGARHFLTIAGERFEIGVLD